MVFTLLQIRILSFLSIPIRNIIVKTIINPSMYDTTIPTILFSNIPDISHADIPETQVTTNSLKITNAELNIRINDP